MNKKKNTPQSHKRGFSLIEMLVAVSLFTVVVFISVGALLAIADANRKANALRTVMDNLNFATESMSRNIRTGTGYNCAGIGNCVVGGDSITFTDQDNVTVTYRYNGTDKSVEVRKELGNFAPITSPQVDIDDLTFYVTGVGTDSDQPRVLISIQGTVNVKERTKTEFTIQTTVSQRELES